MSDVIRFTLDGRAVTRAAGRDHLAGRQAERDRHSPPLLFARAGLPAGRQLPGLHGGHRGRAGARGFLHPQAGGRHGGSCRCRARGALPRHGDGAACSPINLHRRPATDPSCELWDWAGTMGLSTSRFEPRQSPAPDFSHTAMAVNLDACIHCTRCVRACREVQVNDVIGMAGRGARNKIVFDFDDPMGESTCVACGECVQACPTGALMPAQEVGKETPAKQVDSVCPYCGVGCQLTFNVKDNKILWVDGKDGPANHGRLCVKGRFGFDYVNHRHRLTTPLIRREDAPKSADIDIDPANPSTHFREASWDEALDVAGSGPQANSRRARPRRSRRFRLREGIERGSLSLPEARPRRLRHQQRRSLHPALPRLVGGGAAGMQSAPARSPPASTRSSIPTSSS